MVSRAMINLKGLGRRMSDTVILSEATRQRERAPREPFIIFYCPIISNMKTIRDLDEKRG